jgi:hypothetical protein
MRLTGLLVGWGPAQRPSTGVPPNPTPNSETFGFFASGGGVVTQFKLSDGSLSESGNIEELTNLDGDLMGVSISGARQILSIQVVPFFATATEYNSHRAGDMIVPEIGNVLAFQGSPKIRNAYSPAGVFSNTRNWPFVITDIQELGSNNGPWRYQFGLLRSREVDITNRFRHYIEGVLV